MDLHRSTRDLVCFHGLTKSVGSKPAEQGRNDTTQNCFPDQLAGDRSQEDAVAIVPCGVIQAFDLAGSEYWQVILRARPEASPGTTDRRSPKHRRHLQRVAENPGDAARRY